MNTEGRGPGIRSYSAWVALCAVSLAVGYWLAGAASEFGLDPSTPAILRPVKVLGLVLASLVMASSQLGVIWNSVRSRKLWLAMGTLGWSGAVLGSRIATIGLPYNTPEGWAACYVGVLGGGFLGLSQLPALRVDLRGACVWLVISTLSGPALMGGFLLADRWNLGEFPASALCGLTYGVVSGMGLLVLRRPQNADWSTQLTRHPV